MFSRGSTPASSERGHRKRSSSFSGGAGAPTYPVMDANHGHRRNGSGFPSVVPANIAQLARPSPSSSSRVQFPESRPPIRSRSTAPESPTVFAQNTKIHRTIAISHGRPALVYDVIHKPNHLNILHPDTHQPIPAHSLNLPATLPRVTELTLVCRELIWSVIVTSTTNPSHAITNLDVLECVHAALRIPLTRREWESIGQGSKLQARAADAYNKRCMVTKDWDRGVLRCDLLQGRTLLLGVESRADGSHELVFSR